MTFRKKIYLLSGIAAGLVLVYILSFVLDPERRVEREAYYSWLDPADIENITEITIINPKLYEDGDIPISLKKINGSWFASDDETYFPAYQEFIDNFIFTLSERNKYEIRSSSASYHEQLFLNEELAVKVNVMAENMPVLQMLFGKKDNTEKNIFMRLHNQNEIRIGEDRFSVFIDSFIESWYDLRFFPEKFAGKFDESTVQRITVKLPKELIKDGEEGLQIFSRRDDEWDLNFEIGEIERERMERYVRIILDAVGGTFTDSVSTDDPLFDYSSIEIQFGFPSEIKQISIGPLNEYGVYFATVSGSDFVYVLPQWIYSMLFRTNEYFDVSYDVSQQRFFNDLND